MTILGFVIVWQVLGFVGWLVWMSQIFDDPNVSGNRILVTLLIASPAIIVLYIVLFIVCLPFFILYDRMFDDDN